MLILNTLNRKKRERERENFTIVSPCYKAFYVGKEIRILILYQDVEFGDRDTTFFSI